MRFSLKKSSLFLLSLFLLGAKKGDAPNPAPTSNFYVRTTFDTDPSVYVGRFVSEDAAVIDESAARKTQCSQFITHTLVDAGGVEYDEVMGASSGVAQGLQHSATEDGAGVRANYVMTRKMVADISDPLAFDACCRKAEGNCTTRFISEFVEGKGSLWTPHSEFISMKKMAKKQKASPVELGASGGVIWSKNRQFQNPVYFAFKVTEVPKVDCVAMVDNPPESDKGSYFGAVSVMRPDEASAKKSAMVNVQQQIVRYIATEYEDEATLSVNDRSYRYKGGGQALMDDEEFIRTKAEGIASKVKAELFCPVEAVDTPEGPLFQSRVLAFITNEQLEIMARQVLGE